MSNLIDDVESVGKNIEKMGSNFFESASNDIAGLEKKLLGPRYSYSDHIKSPDQMGMSGDGQSISANVDGLQAYVKLLFSGGGNASTVNGPLGKQFFLKTGAKCKDKKSGEQVTRSLYINNIPVENTPLNKGMTLLFGKSQGLIPGILNNIENVNPLGIFGAFMQGSNPDCMSVTLPTRNANNVKGKDTQYLTVSDVKNLSPCLFSNKTNPVTKKGASCIEGFENKVENYDKDDLEILDILFPDKELNVLKYSDIIAYIYFISLILLFLSLIKKTN